MARKRPNETLKEKTNKKPKKPATETTPKRTTAKASSATKKRAATSARRKSTTPSTKARPRKTSTLSPKKPTNDDDDDYEDVVDVGTNLLAQFDERMQPNRNNEKETQEEQESLEKKPLTHANGTNAVYQQEEEDDGVEGEEDDEEDDEGDDEEEEEEEVEEEIGQQSVPPDEEDEIPAPVVFQCGTCRSIFGDSWAFVCSNADLLLVTLRAVTNITVSKETVTSKEGIDLGSSYHELLCKQCQTVLGRRYLTTPMPLDAIRGLYSFATPVIASYQLGFPQVQTDAQNLDAIKQATTVCDHAMKKLAYDHEEITALQENMKKVQNLLLVVDERLQQLETEEVDSEDDVKTPTPTKQR